MMVVARYFFGSGYDDLFRSQESVDCFILDEDSYWEVFIAIVSLSYYVYALYLHALRYEDSSLIAIQNCLVSMEVCEFKEFIIKFCVQANERFVELTNFFIRAVII